MVAENCTTQNLGTHPISSPAHPPPPLYFLTTKLQLAEFCQICWVFKGSAWYFRKSTVMSSLFKAPKQYCSNAVKNDAKNASYFHLASLVSESLAQTV